MFLRVTVAVSVPSVPPSVFGVLSMTDQLTVVVGIADQTRIALLDEISTHYYHSLRRNPNQLPKAYDLSGQQKILEGFADEMAVSQLANYQGLDAILRRHEETHQVMFLTTWSNSSWTLEEFAQAEDMLRSETLPTNDLCLFVSAVTLSLMECFDERKVNWLLDGLRHTNPQINQRALVGLVITLHLYPSRIALSNTSNCFATISFASLESLFTFRYAR